MSTPYSPPYPSDPQQGKGYNGPQGYGPPPAGYPAQPSGYATVPTDYPPPGQQPYPGQPPYQGQYQNEQGYFQVLL